MAFFDNLKTKTQELSNGLKTKAGQFKNKDFANASMAMCALIAAADGTIDPEERRKTAALITANDILAIFPPADLRATFDQYCDKLERDYDFGKVEVISVVGKLKKKDDQARAVLQIGIIIGGADGNFDQHERQAVKEACFAVGIAPAEFDL